MKGRPLLVFESGLGASDSQAASPAHANASFSQGRGANVPEWRKMLHMAGWAGCCIVCCQRLMANPEKTLTQARLSDLWP